MKSSWHRTSWLPLVVLLAAPAFARTSEAFLEQAEQAEQVNQSAPSSDIRPTREQFISVAREIMAGAGFGALITSDLDGRPAARIMDPFLPDENMIVWMATNPRSRKVEQIRKDPRVTLFYFDPSGPDYVTLHGDARLVDDREEKARHWKAGWDSHYPDRNDSLLIEFVPRALELVSVEHGFTSDPETWTPYSIVLGAKSSR